MSSNAASASRSTSNCGDPILSPTTDSSISTPLSPATAGLEGGGPLQNLIHGIQHLAKDTRELLKDTNYRLGGTVSASSSSSSVATPNAAAAVTSSSSSSSSNLGGSNVVSPVTSSTFSNILSAADPNSSSNSSSSSTSSNTNRSRSNSYSTNYSFTNNNMGIATMNGEVIGGLPYNKTKVIYIVRQLGNEVLGANIVTQWEIFMKSLVRLQKFINQQAKLYQIQVGDRYKPYTIL